MLRFSSLNKISLVLKGCLPYGLAARPFSSENIPEEKLEDEEEVEIEVEGEEAIEEVEELEEGLETREITRVYRKVKLNDYEALQLALDEYNSFRKSSNYGPFTFSKRAEEITDEQINKLHREVFESVDIGKETRSKIGYLIQELSSSELVDPVTTYEKIEDLIHRSFTRGDYDVFYDRDFRTLIFNKSFLPFIDLLFKKEFVQANPTLFTELDLIQSLKLIAKDQDFFPLLQFVRYTAPARSEKAPSVTAHVKLAEEFLQAFANSNQFNYFAFVHYYFNLSKGSILDNFDFSKFVDKLLNIHWGKPSKKVDRQEFFGHLYDLLMIKLNVEENQALKYYFADMFLTSHSYDIGLKMMGHTLLILNRLSNNSLECKDLYYTFIQRFGENKFNFYIKESMPALLTLIRKKKLANLCKQTLQAFQNQPINSHSQIKPVILDILDQNFYQKNSKIYYSYKGTSELDFLVDFSFYQEKKKEEKVVQDESELLKKALNNRNPNDFIELFHEECQRDTISREIYKKTYDQCMRNVNPLEDVSTNQMLNFLDSLTVELENEFLQATRDDKFVNTTLYKKKKYSPSYKESSRIGLQRKTITISSEKGFSTFIGNKRNPSISLGLSNKIFSSFGTEDAKKTAEKQNSSPFKDFLKKAEEIDQQVKNKQLSQDEVSNMKKSLYEKKEKKGDGIKFAKIENVLASPSKADAVQPEASYIFTEDYWNRVIGNSSEIPHLLSKIEDHFLNFTDLVKAQNAIENFVESEPFVNKGLSNHRMALYKMFNQPSINKLSPQELENLHLNFRETQLNLEPSEKLHLNFVSNQGEVEKDYNKYLTSNLFHYSIGEKGYKCILQIIGSDYKRKYFKKCIAHIARFSSDISTENLKLITDICYDQKIAFTLLEAAQLFIQNGVINRPDQLAIIIEKLRFFKDLADSSEQLAKSFVQYTGIPFSISLMGSHLDLLMKYGKYEKFMPIFDRLKESVGSQRYIYDSSLSGEENLNLQEKWKAKNKEILSQLYRDFIQKLNEYKIYSFSKLLYKEQKELKLTLTQQDYINAIFINKDNLQDLESILKAIGDYNDAKFSLQASFIFLDTISENPKVLKTLVSSLLEELVYTHKMDLTTALASRIGFVMTKTADTAPLTKFIEFLINEGPPLKPSLKISFLKLLNSSDDQLMKPHNLGQIEKLFSKEEQEKSKDREKAKRQAREAAQKDATTAVEGEISEAVQPQVEKETKDAEKPKEVAPVKESKKEKKGKKAAGKKGSEAEKVETEAKEPTEPVKEKGKMLKFMVRKKSGYDLQLPKPAKQGVRFRRISYRDAEEQRELEGNTPIE